MSPQRVYSAQEGHGPPRGIILEDVEVEVDGEGEQRKWVARQCMCVTASQLSFVECVHRAIVSGSCVERKRIQEASLLCSIF